MNTLLLLTAENHIEMSSFAKELGQKQKIPNNGKLLVMAGYYLDDEILQNVGESLKDCFEVVELSKIQISEKSKNENQLATILATFFMQRYTTVPGAWLVVDSHCDIIKDNPISMMEHCYNANRVDNAGRATTIGGGRVPIGPVVIGAEVKKLRSLRFISGQDWRQRGRWAFNVCYWFQFSPEDYPFRFKTALQAPASNGNIEQKPEEQSKPHPTEPLTSQKTLPVVKPNQSKPEATNPINGIKGVAMKEMQTEGTAEDLVERVALAQDKTPQQIYEARLASEEKKEKVAGDEGYIPPTRKMTKEEMGGIPQHPGSALEDVKEEAQPKQEGPKPESPKKPFVRVDSSAYEKVSHEVLIEQVAHRVGRKPHPKTKSEKLIKKLQELDEVAAASGKQ